jgi:hypothetical protein
MMNIHQFMKELLTFEDQKIKRRSTVNRVKSSMMH